MPVAPAAVARAVAPERRSPAAGSPEIGCGSGARTSFAFFGSARSAIFIGGAFAVGRAGSGSALAFAFSRAAGGSRWVEGAGSALVASFGIDRAAAFGGAPLGSSGWSDGSVAAARAEGGASRVG